jgi:hypothetical protein
MQYLHTNKLGFFFEKDSFQDSFFGKQHLDDWFPQIGGSPYLSESPVMP